MVDTGKDQTVQAITLLTIAIVNTPPDSENLYSTYQEHIVLTKNKKSVRQFVDLFQLINYPPPPSVPRPLYLSNSSLRLCESGNKHPRKFGTWEPKPLYRQIYSATWEIGRYFIRGLCVFVLPSLHTHSLFFIYLFTYFFVLRRRAACQMFIFFFKCDFVCDVTFCVLFLREWKSFTFGCDVNYALGYNAINMDNVDNMPCG